jgi:signal recognition particle subunit SRP54
MKLGPISKVMGMLPGMSPDMVKMMDGEGGTNHIKKMMTIFDSMTDEGILKTF